MGRRAPTHTFGAVVVFVAVVVVRVVVWCLNLVWFKVGVLRQGCVSNH